MGLLRGGGDGGGASWPPAPAATTGHHPSPIGSHTNQQTRPPRQ
jgi:hypothetical protein